MNEDNMEANGNSHPGRSNKKQSILEGINHMSEPQERQEILSNPCDRNDPTSEPNRSQGVEE